MLLIYFRGVTHTSVLFSYWCWIRQLFILMLKRPPSSKVINYHQIFSYYFFLFVLPTASHWKTARLGIVQCGDVQDGYLCNLSTITTQTDVIQISYFYFRLILRRPSNKMYFSQYAFFVMDSCVVQNLNKIPN